MDIVDAFEFDDEECFDYNEMDDVVDDVDDVINTGGGGGVRNQGVNLHLRLERMKEKRKAAENAMRNRKFFSLGTVKGKITYLPCDFSFPKMTSEQLVRNWLLPCIKLRNDQRISYRKLTAGFLKPFKGAIEQRQSMSRFMAVVEFYGRLEKCWDENNNWSQEKVSLLWNKVGHPHIYAKYAGRSSQRLETLAWPSMLTQMKKRGAFRKSLEKCLDPSEWNRSIYNISLLSD